MEVSASFLHFTDTEADCAYLHAMGLVFSRRKRLGRGTMLNLSKSGASVSKRMGRVTVNSRGKASIRLGKGLRWRF